MSCDWSSRTKMSPRRSSYSNKYVQPQSLFHKFVVWLMAEQDEGSSAARNHASTQARLKQARKDRQRQIRDYNKREKEESSKSKKKRNQKAESRSERIKFTNSIVILEAAARNDVEEVQNLLRSGISPNSSNEDGLTALHQCCIDHYPEMMKLLITHGADVNACDSEMWTPLHAAATCAHFDLVQYLIANGANLLAVNSDGNMPYDICEDDNTLDFIESEMSKRGITQDLIDVKRLHQQHQLQEDIESLIRERKSLNNPRATDNATFLHIAAANGYLEATDLLLENGADVNVKDKDGWQPIHAAACWAHLEVITLLLKFGASLDTLTHNFETALDLCDDDNIKKAVEDLQSQQLSRQAFFRRSGSKRRSSVRRSSMREKKEMQKREAIAEFSTALQADSPSTAKSQTSGSNLNIPEAEFRFADDITNESPNDVFVDPSAEPNTVNDVSFDFNNGDPIVGNSNVDQPAETIYLPEGSLSELKHRRATERARELGSISLPQTNSQSLNLYKNNFSNDDQIDRKFVGSDDPVNRFIEHPSIVDKKKKKCKVM